MKLEWEPTVWWRAIGPDGELWCESSSEDEVFEQARIGDRIEHLWRTTPVYEWRAVSVKRTGPGDRHEH